MTETTAPTGAADRTNTAPEVLIVGAGPIGLTLAISLRAAGVSVTVLEAHSGLSTHPKARGISARSMETFRALGLEAAIRAVALPADQIRFFRGDTLADPDFTRSEPPTTHASGATPAPGVLCSQDVLEPVLCEAARAAGAELRFGHRVTEVLADADGVRVRALGPAGAVAELRAAFLVGCDGAGSTVRRAAGIPLQGERGIARFLSIRCAAELTEVVRDRAAASYFLTGGKGGFLAIDNRTQWIYQYPLPDGDDGAGLREDPAALGALVRAAAGLPELAVDVQDTLVWRMDARIADSYRAGRILLAGDAAHQTPPTGGHGMNVGIGDAEALAWRLAAVLAEQAGPELLDDYTRERRPVGAAIIEISRGNFGGRYGIDDELLLGVRVGAEPPLEPGPYAPAGDAGRRVPHAPLSDGGSTLDLLGGDWVLVSVDSERWSAEAVDAALASRAAALPAGRRPVPVVLRQITGESEAEPGAFAARAGLASAAGATGEEPRGAAATALLVRPDGHIAARLRGPEELAAALTAALGGAGRAGGAGGAGGAA